MTPKSKKRLILVTIILAFVGPTLLAVLLTSRWIDWHPPGTRNHGELLTPPLSLAPATVAALQAAGEAWPTEGSRWTVLARMPATCTDSCRAELELLLRLHTAFGRRAGDVHLIAFSAPVDPERRDSAALTVLTVDPPAQLAELLPASSGPVYVVADPEGLVILRYAVGSDPTGLRRDVNHLLTWSKRKS